MDHFERVADNLWEATTPLKVAPGFHLPTRMLVVEVAPGELLLYSPLELTDEQVASLQSAGSVRWILAPNDYHHMYVAKAARRFPEAQVWGSPRAVSKHSDVSWTGVLTESRPDLPESVVPLNVEGMSVVNETVLWMPDSRALLTTDLVLNVHAADRKPWLTKAVLGFFLDYGDRPTQGKEYRWFFVRDRDAYRESMHDLVSRDVELLSMAHGELVHTGGAAALKTAVDWAL
jgi:hypothetical protein